MLRSCEVQMSNVKRPGEVAYRSGEYEIIGPRGGHTGKERTVVKGERLPPTPGPGQGYKISRPAHNNSGRAPRR